MVPDEELSEEDDESSDEDDEDDEEGEEGVLVLVWLTCAVVGDDPSAGSLPAAIWM